MKKIFLLLVAIVTFVLSGSGEIKDINDALKHKSSHSDESGRL
ncbi:hypothetical protein [Sulfurovum riftiae]|nr:hypothetical protein [Sulfurovum riftiae]